AGQLKQYFLDVERRELHPAPVDKLLDTPGDEEHHPALVVYLVEPLIAGAEPAELERLGVGVGPVEVVLHDVVPPDADLSALAWPEPLAPTLCIEDGHLVRLDGRADGGIAVVLHPVAVSLPVKRDRQEARVAGRLAQAVAVHNGDVEGFLERRRQRDGKGSRTADKV